MKMLKTILASLIVTTNLSAEVVTYNPAYGTDNMVLTPCQLFTFETYLDVPIEETQRTDVDQNLAIESLRKEFKEYKRIIYLPHQKEKNFIVPFTDANDDIDITKAYSLQKKIYIASNTPTSMPALEDYVLPEDLNEAIGKNVYYITSETPFTVKKIGEIITPEISNTASTETSTSEEIYNGFRIKITDVEFRNLKEVMPEEDIQKFAIHDKFSEFEYITNNGKKDYPDIFHITTRIDPNTGELMFPDAVLEEPQITILRVQKNLCAYELGTEVSDLESEKETLAEKEREESDLADLVSEVRQEIGYVCDDTTGDCYRPDEATYGLFGQIAELEIDLADILSQISLKNLEIAQLTTALDTIQKSIDERNASIENNKLLIPEYQKYERLYEGKLGEVNELYKEIDSISREIADIRARLKQRNAFIAALIDGVENICQLETVVKTNLLDEIKNLKKYDVNYIKGDTVPSKFIIIDM